MKNQSLFIASIALISSTALAGGNGSHGGNLVSCYNQPVYRTGEPVEPGHGPVKLISRELLDFFEGRTNPKNGTNKIDMGPKNTTYLQKVKFVLERLKQTDKERAEKLLKRLNSFFQQTALLPAAEIPKIDDFRIIDSSTFANCYVHQWAAQDPDVDAGDLTRLKFKIDKRLFNDPLVSEESRAGLILHELLYEEKLHHIKTYENALALIKKNNTIQNILNGNLKSVETDENMKGAQKNSDKVRPVVYLVSSEKINTLNGLQYAFFMFRMQFPVNRVETPFPAKINDLYTSAYTRYGEYTLLEDSEILVNGVPRSFSAGSIVRATNPDPALAFDPEIPYEQWVTTHMYANGGNYTLVDLHGARLTRFKNAYLVFPLSGPSADSFRFTWVDGPLDLEYVKDGEVHVIQNARWAEFHESGFLKASAK